MESVEVVWASVECLLGFASFGGFPNTPNREESLGLTQNLLERLHVSSGLGAPQDLPRAGKRHRIQGHLNYFVEPDGSRIPLGSIWMVRRMDGHQNCT